MKAFLMYDDRDLGRVVESSTTSRALARDLDLERLFTAMAAEDPYLYDAAQKALRTPLTTVGDITYRQQNLIDALENPDTVRALYALAEDTVAAEKKIYHSIFFNYPDAILRRSIESLELLIGMMRRLRTITDDNKDKFHSPGFTRFFTMITDELNEDYFQLATQHLDLLRLHHGVLISAGLGYANKGEQYTLRRPNRQDGNWLQRIYKRQDESYSFDIHPRDEAGARALAELHNHGIALAAHALDQADAHIVSFFTMLRAELAFYIGCLNLCQVLDANGGPICFPKPEPVNQLELGARNLHDLSLVLAGTARVVGNDMDAGGRNLIVVTGANEGGKSTFLRSLGTSQLMMQCGMFVCADYFTSSISNGIHTHYKREEDTELQSGKLDEELDRMSAIADNLARHSLVLFNESFSATNEREGSAIARNIISALLDTNMRVVFVTHFFDLAHGLYSQHLPNALFLQAQREANGRRTHRIVQGEPIFTSFGEDLYRQIFSQAPESSPRCPAGVAPNGQKPTPYPETDET
ncbi:DNA mismatch repair protein MutS [Arthrobacter livingstonensis]|uniref:DNA mismatch repair protein MutS n=1 Tax=Arthrobacter livingstonensis TaxID=670078 RepID=A0A2V5L607_9MICC|nr:DNA mismatch repair protein MutS [Arthrobacter livingstonensis]PYI65153.1 DNA mismatch repair protein MutS [Arthrobacter livingstonensis]